MNQINSLYPGTESFWQSSQLHRGLCSVWQGPSLHHYSSEVPSLQRFQRVESLMISFSDKVCGKMLSKLSWGPSRSSTKTSPSRNYIEESDTEMDIWVYMTKSSHLKSVSLLVTPFRKICDPKDNFFRACQKQNRWHFVAF